MMKKLIKLSFIALVATFTFAACESKNAENETENSGEAIEADVEQGADATTDAVDEAGEEVEEGAENVEEGAEEVKD